MVVVLTTLFILVSCCLGASVSLGEERWPVHHHTCHCITDARHAVGHLIADNRWKTWYEHKTAPVSTRFLTPANSFSTIYCLCAVGGGGGGPDVVVEYPELYWMIVAPCNLLPGVYSDLLAPFLLGWFGFVGGLCMWYRASAAHQRGLAVI